MRILWRKNNLWAEAIYWFHITIIFMVDVFLIYLKEISIIIIYSGARILWRKNSLRAEAIYWLYITIIFMVDIFFIYLKEISTFIIYLGARILWRKNNLRAEAIYWLYITIELISNQKNKGFSPIISPFKSINLKLEIKGKIWDFRP